MTFTFPEYQKHDAIGLANLIKTKEISPKELFQAALSRLEAVNPKINAVSLVLHELAEKQLERVNENAPLAGVPTLLKDIQMHLTDTPLSEGSLVYKNRVSESNSYFVDKMIESGLIIIGKSTTSEFAIKGVTEVPWLPPTRNPWDLQRTPGGSSGGSAAAVAAGIVPIASASDGGGSIRIPASYCGLLGLKPSRGRVSPGPYFSELWGGLSAALVVSRSVRDSALSLDLFSGAMPGDAYGAVNEQTGFLSSLNEKPAKLKIAYTLRSPFDNDLDAESTQAITKTVKLLESMGHELEEKDPNIDFEALAESYFTVLFSDIANKLNTIKSEFGKKKMKQCTELDSQLIALMGRAIPACDYVKQRINWNIFSREMAQFFGQYDCYLTPTTGSKPAQIGELATSSALQKIMRVILASPVSLAPVLKQLGIIDKLAMKNLKRTPFTQLANITGIPAISVPLFVGEKSGLPFGSHFMAKMGNERLLLQLARSLEEAEPWANRSPVL